MLRIGLQKENATQLIVRNFWNLFDMMLCAGDRVAPEKPHSTRLSPAPVPWIPLVGGGCEFSRSGFTECLQRAG